MQFTKEEFELEKQRRATAKRDKLQADFSPYKERGLWEFLKYMAPEFYTDEKLPLIELSEILRKISIGELRKVLISMFPRAGKSRTTSLWIVWWLGYDQDGSFMRNCYSDQLALDFSKAVLDILASDQYKSVFPEVKIDPRASSKVSWQLLGTSIATYFGAGINGTITGKGCSRAAILDDPIKNAMEAMSEPFMNGLETFIEAVHNTRIEANSQCAEIIIQTRWSKNDPIGIRETDPTWHKFIFPALKEDGTSICEAMVSTEWLLERKESWERKGLGWMFEALYMCRPVDNEFTKFSLDDLKRFKMADIQAFGSPDEVLAWCDYANKGTDNMSCPFALRYGERLYIAGVVFSNHDSTALRQPLIEKIAFFKPNRMTFESNQGGVEFATNFEETYEKILNAIGLEIETKYATSNKHVRILLYSGQIKNNCYFLVDDEQDDQYERFMDNLANYGKYRNSKDDAPDSMAGLCSMTSDTCEVDVEIFSSKSLDTNARNEKAEKVDDGEDEVYIF